MAKMTSVKNKSKLAGTNAADVLTVKHTQITVNAGKGNDKINVKSGAGHKIYGEAGNEMIVIAAKAGAGSKVYGDDAKGKLTGKDTFTINGGKKNYFYGGKGVDTFKINGGSTNYIYGEAGNDVITVGAEAGSGSKIYGDDAKGKLTGKDTFTINGGKKNYFYGGKGVDTFNVNGGTTNYIYGGTGNDEITIGKNSKGKAVVKDFSVKKGNTDKVKVIGGAVKNIAVSGKNMIIKGGKSASLTLQKAKNKTFTVTDTRGKYTVNGENVKLVLGKNYKSNLNAASFITTVDARNAVNNITINGNAKNNTIYAGKAGGTINGGAGDDTLYGGVGKDTFVYAGGNETIYNYVSGSDTIKLSSTTLKSTSVSGEDIILNLASGEKITVKNSANTEVLIVDPSGKSLAINDSNAAGGSTAYGSDGVDTFVYNASDGNTVIKDYTEGEDTLQIADSKITKTEIVDGNVVLTVGDEGNTITLESAAGKTVDIHNKNGSLALSEEEISLGTDYTGDIDANAYPSTVTKIDGSNAERSIDITGNAQDNTIYAGKAGGTINGGIGNDALYGGAGNDKLAGGAGNDTFVYGNGQGNDTIADYTAGQDTLQISSGSIGKTALANSNKDVVFAVGSGSITLNNASTKAISLKDNRGSYTASNTAITLGNDFAGTMDATKYLSSVKTIDGRNATKAVDITGNAQDNTIYAGKVGGTINGGIGNDALYGGAGSDTYVISSAFTSDTMISINQTEFTTGSADVLYLQTLNHDTVSYSLAGGVLTITDNTTGGRVTVAGWDVNPLASIQFADNKNISSELVNEIVSGISYVVPISESGSYTGEHFRNVFTFSGSGWSVTIQGAGRHDTLDFRNYNDGRYGFTNNYRSGDTLYLTFSQFNDGDSTTKIGTVYISNYYAATDKLGNVVLYDDACGEVRSYNMLADLDGGAGDDLIFKNTADNDLTNVLDGGDGDDVIFGSRGSDSLNGGDGKDTLYGGSGNDTLNGGAGNDKLYGQGGNNTLNGDAGNDILYGGDGNGTLNGGAGDDILYGGKYPDTFIYAAGEGNDIIKDLNNNSQSDTLQITNGFITKTEVAGDNVVFTVGSGTVTLEGAKGQTINIIDGNGTHKVTEDAITVYDDYTGTMDANAYFDTVQTISMTTQAKGVTIIGNAQNNTVYGGYESDTMYGSAGDDTLNGNKGDDTLNGGAGNDTILGGDGNDNLHGGDGDDNLQGGAGDDTLYGSAGNDTLYGGNGNDTFVFDNDYTGNNTIQSFEESNDVVRFADDMHITGFTFNTETNNAIALDVSTGGTVNFTSVYGKTIAFKDHNDGDFAVAIGTFNNDTLTGTSGDDILYGLSGADTLNGNAGNDTLYGCAGKDIFIYGAGEGNDIIKDYVQNEDTLTISNGFISKTETDAGNLVFTAGGGTVTLEGAADKIISMTDANGSYTVSAETITLGSDYSGTLNSNAYLSTVVTIDGSSAAGGLGITGNSQNNVISGGAGNDMLTGGAGNDTFVYTGGDDVVTDYTARQDTLQVSGDSISDMAVTNNNKDIMFTVGEGSVTLQNASGKELSLKDENGSFTVSGSTVTLGSDFTGSLDADIFSADTIYVGDCKGSVLTGGQGTDNFIFVNPTGNHMITDYEHGTDILRFDTDTVTDSAVSGTDVVLTLSGGATVTIQNQATHAVTFTDATNTEISVNPNITQQSVIKSFVKGLDDSTLLISDTTAGMNQVIRYSSNNLYNSWNELVTDLINKVQSFGAENSTQAKEFLTTYCGIDLTNADTGSITGLDADGPVEKTKDSVVPESGATADFVYPTSPTTTFNGLTFHWPENPADDLEIAVIKGLNTWWAEEGLKLIEESYGLSFTEEGTGTTDITVVFKNENSGTLASVSYNIPSSGPSTHLTLHVNKYYVSEQLLSNVSGYCGDQEYLDRTLAHELTHAVMAANIEGFSKLPDSLREGTAELVHGIDDVRTSDIRSLAYASDVDYLQTCLTNRKEDSGTLYVESYAAGYMALRYFAKQVADYWSGDSMTQSNGMLASSVTDTGASTLNMASVQNALLDFADPFISDSLSGTQRDESKNESLFISGNV